MRELPPSDYIKLPHTSFILRNGLILYIDKENNRERLYILKSIEQKIFELAYDNKSYRGLQRTYKRIVEYYYIRYLARRLKRYILYYPEYLRSQTKRYPTFGFLKLIIILAIPYYTITIDFILALPLLESGFNTIISATCKFSKHLTSVPGKDT